MFDITTLNGNTIPPIGLGTYPLRGEQMATITQEAIRVGFRLIDTADDYQNEDAIGKGCAQSVKDGIVRREDLFLQTKISDNSSWHNDPLAGVYFSKYSHYMKNHSVEEVVREKVDHSLRMFQTHYLDSVLIHLPYSGYYIDIWKALEKLHKEGIIRYIGVSNFHERHLCSLKESCDIVPMINQIYMSPIGTKCDLVSFCNANNIQLMTYSPLIDVAARRIENSQFLSLAQKYNKSMAQIILRWNVECGSCPLPKTSNPSRLKENFDIFDFSLTKEEVEIITSMNYDFQYLVESKICPGL